MSEFQIDLLIGMVCLIALTNLVMFISFVIETRKIGKLFDEVETFKATNNAEMNSMVWHEKKLEGEVSEIILELRRTNKLIYEMSGAGVTDYVQEYHDSDTFRRERADKFKSHSGISNDNTTAATNKDAISNQPDIDALTKTPVINRKSKISAEAEYIKKMSEKNVPGKNLVQKMLEDEM